MNTSETLQERVQDIKDLVSQFKTEINTFSDDIKKEKGEKIQQEIDNLKKETEEKSTPEEKAELQKQLEEIEKEYKQVIEEERKNTNELTTEILDTAPPEIKDVVDKINSEKDNPEETKTQESIWKLIKSGQIGKALTRMMESISAIFFGKKMAAGLEKYKSDRDASTIERFKAMDPQRQDSTLTRLENKVKQSGISLNKKLRFTYVRSRAKDIQLERETPGLTPFQKLAKNIKPGDVLLMNKDSKEKDQKRFEKIGNRIANQGLQKSSNSIRTHTVLVTAVDGENIEITHASGAARKVVAEDLESYLKGYEAADVAVLQTPEESSAKAIEFARENIGKEYDAKAAFQQTMGENKKDDKYNCGELVGDSLTHANPVIFKDLEAKTYPSDFLMNEYLQPWYITTIREKEI